MALRVLHSRVRGLIKTLQDAMSYYVVGVCRLFKEVETSIDAGENFEFRLENHSAWQSITKQSSRPVPKIDDAPEAIPDSAKARNEERRRQIPGDGRHDPRAGVVHSAGWFQ